MGYGDSVENRKLRMFTNSLLCWLLLCNNLRISVALDNKSLCVFSWIWESPWLCWVGLRSSPYVCSCFLGSLSTQGMCFSRQVIREGEGEPNHTGPAKTPLPFGFTGHSKPQSFSQSQRGPEATPPTMILMGKAG